jgi:hypothetical protein
MDLLAHWLQVLVNIFKYSIIADLHNFQFTFAYALGLSIITGRILAMDINTETSTSNHYEAFLLFRHQ